MRLARHNLWIASLLWIVLVIPVARAQDTVSENAQRLETALLYLENGNEDEQGWALHELSQLPLPAVQAVPLFQAHIQRQTKTFNEAALTGLALTGLAKYGTRGQSVLPDLIHLLDEVGTVQGQATNGNEITGPLTDAISKIGPDDPKAVAALQRTLRRCLDNPKPLKTLLEETATALGQMHAPAHAAAPLLTLGLSRSPGSTPQLAAALSHMMPEASLALPALVRALEAGRSPEAVAEALGNMGPAAKSTLPTLHRTLTHASPLLACKAIAAIAHIEGQPNLTVQEARTILQQIDRYPLTQVYTAFTAIKQEGTKATAAIAILTQIAEQHKASWLHLMALETLAVVNPPPANPHPNFEKF